MTIETDNPEIELDLGDNPKSVTVNLESETPAAPEPVAAAPEKPKAEPEKPENELEQYSEKVQKRIDRLTARLRETERREQAALEYAQGVQRQAEELSQRLHYTDNGRLTEAKGRIETQALTLKQIIKKAREEGDIDTETEALERLTSLQMEQRQIAEQTQRAQTPPPPVQPYAAPQRAQTPPDPRAEDWALANPWFGTNVTMTKTAWEIHKQLVDTEKFDASSDEYYDELDRRVRAVFPNEFNAEPQREVPQQQPRAQRPVQAVAPATRSSGVNSSARRAVRLSPSQVAIAKKLGVPLEEYAKYVKE